jgi:hypothetical protein
MKHSKKKLLTAFALPILLVTLSGAGGPGVSRSGGGSGSGDVSGPSSSVDNEIVLFSGTSGKEIKRATATGVLKGTSGVLSAATAGTDYTSPSSTETMTNKTLTLPKLTSSVASTTETTFWNDSTRKTVCQYINGIQACPPGVIFVQTADGGPSNTVNETSLFGTGVGTRTLPANFFVAGKTVRVFMKGYMNTAGSSPGNLTVRVKYGSTLLGTTTTAALVTGANEFEWTIDTTITCRTTGASGTVSMQGTFQHNRSSSTPVWTVHAIGNGTFAHANTSAVTIDTTAASEIEATAQFSATGSGTNRITSTVAYLEILN